MKTGWCDGEADRGSCLLNLMAWVWSPDSRNARREPTLQSWPLTSTHVSPSLHYTVNNGCLKTELQRPEDVAKCPSVHVQEIQRWKENQSVFLFDTWILTIINHWPTSALASCNTVYFPISWSTSSIVTASKDPYLTYQLSPLSWKASTLSRP